MLIWGLRATSTASYMFLLSPLPIPRRFPFQPSRRLSQRVWLVFLLLIASIVYSASTVASSWLTPKTRLALHSAIDLAFS